MVPNKPTSQLFNCIATDDKKELHGQDDWQTKKVDAISRNWDVAKMVMQYKINISELQVYEDRLELELIQEMRGQDSVA